MELSKKTMLELSELISDAVVTSLEKRGLVGRASANPKMEKTAYQKTEQLLYNYNGFKRIVDERMKEIEDIKRFGVPQTCGAGGERVQNGNLPSGIVLPEESVEAAVHNVEASVQDTVQAIALIDKCMAALKNDPYYKILEMRYFEGRTQEDIALEFKCVQATVAKNKSRLVKELSMRLFPDQAINEMIK